jgi:L-alanine-DL-glutamate epimerase-like enolase superfamily enzyme
MRGVGECVAWTKSDQVRFAAACLRAVPSGQSRVADVIGVVRNATSQPYERAALEAAVIDLALRQANTNLFELSGVAPRPVRFLVSFDALADPVRFLGGYLDASPAARIKLDVDPAWSDETFRGLASLERVVVLDLKQRGDLSTAERAHAALPEALIEDPPLDTAESQGEAPVPHSLRARVSLDISILTARNVETLPFSPAAINVKPARMGSVMEALRTVGACRGAGIATYVGGMFEVGPGRSQVQVLASLTSPEAWNDVAPLTNTPQAPHPESPLTLPVDFTGLGFEVA